MYLVYYTVCMNWYNILFGSAVFYTECRMVYYTNFVFYTEKVYYTKYGIVYYTVQYNGILYQYIGLVYYTGSMVV